MAPHLQAQPAVETGSLVGLVDRIDGLPNRGQFHLPSESPLDIVQGPPPKGQRDPQGIVAPEGAKLRRKTGPITERHRERRLAP